MELPIPTLRGRRGVLLFSALMALAMLLIVGLALRDSASAAPAQQGDDGRLGPEDIIDLTGPITATDPLERYKQAHFVEIDPLRPDQPPDLSSSYKSVSAATAVAGDSLAYSVVISNTGDAFATAALTDTLPAGLAYEPGSLSVIGGGQYGESGGVITWTGAVNNGFYVTVQFNAQLDGGLLPGDVVTNTAVILGGGAPIFRSAATAIVSQSITSTSFLPYIAYPPPLVTALNISRPNSNNQWTVSWSGSAATGFELQEDDNPDFSSPTVYNVGLATSKVIQKAPSYDNVYYYRVRAISGPQVGAWSAVKSVVGGYFDDFVNTDGEWKIRRTTFIEEVRMWHEIDATKSWLIMQVEDSWDWGIAAPEAPAPSVPYVIEYRSQVANTSNLVSQGMVFGGDWPGDICPDPSTVAGWYQHELCFNHFYNTNTIFFGPMKMLFERVDELVWCPSCGGSPMKRLGDTKSVDTIPNVDPDGWNVWRIEVRPNSIKLFANGQMFMEYSDTRWINDPYFGVFGSTDEYSNSTTRFDWVSVMPLDG